MKCEIKGIAPVLFDNFAATIDDQLQKKKKTKGNAAVGLWNKDQFYYSGKNGGGVAIPIKLWLEQAMKEGAKRVKMGRKSLKDEANGNIAVIEEFCETNTKEPTYVCRSYPKTAYGRVISEKPGFLEWGCEFTLMVVNEDVPPEKIAELLDSVGIYQGLGAWHPKHGRFEVIEAKRI